MRRDPTEWEKMFAKQNKSVIKKQHIVQFHLYDKSRIDKSTEKESGL